MYLGLSKASRYLFAQLFCGLAVFFFYCLSVEAAGPQCRGIFEIAVETREPALTDAREAYEQNGHIGFMKIGEGNSGTIFLFKNENGEFKVAKFYKPERAANLERDHLGLKEVQMLFDHDQFHSIQFRVARSHIQEGLRSEHGSRALIMDYHPGYNLHTLLVNTPRNHPLHKQAEALYQKFVKELDKEAHMMGFRDELRSESDKFFQDHVVDGLPVLIIEGTPRLLIKTDNIIFNPAENTLTLIDPY